MPTPEVHALIELLGRLGTLSANHGYSWHADYIRETADTFQISENAGWDRLASVQFWGGAGSIDDVHFGPDEVEWHKQNHRPVPTYLNALSEDGYSADNREYLALLARIARALRCCPPTAERQRWIERAQYVGAAFEKWVRNRQV